MTIGGLFRLRRDDAQPVQCPHSARTAHFEEAAEGFAWPIKLREVLIDAKKAVAKACADGQSAIKSEQHAELLARYDRWVGLGLP